MKLNWVAKIYIFISTLMLSTFAFADDDFGTLAQNMTSVTGDISQFIMSICFIISAGFGVGMIIKYKAHRDNPTAVPISMPITLFFISLAFACLGILMYVTGATVFGSNAPITTSSIGVDHLYY